MKRVTESGDGTPPPPALARFCLRFAMNGIPSRQHDTFRPATAPVHSAYPPNMTGTRPNPRHPNGSPSSSNADPRVRSPDDPVLAKESRFHRNTLQQPLQPRPAASCSEASRATAGNRDNGFSVGRAKGQRENAARPVSAVIPHMV